MQNVASTTPDVIHEIEQNSVSAGGIYNLCFENMIQSIKDDNYIGHVIYTIEGPTL